MHRKQLTHIGIVCGGLMRAGLERIVCDLARQMREQGVDARIFAFKGGPLAKELYLRKIPFTILSGSEDGSGYKGGGFMSAWMASKLAVMFRRMKAQAVNAHGLGVERISFVAARMAAISVRTFVFHNNYPEFVPNPTNYKSRQRIKSWLRKSSKCIAVSNFVKQWSIDNQIVTPDQVTVIENGINVEAVRPKRPGKVVRKELGLHSTDPVLIQVGRFAAQKNQATSIQAMQLILRRIPNCRLLFVGDGPLRPHAEKITQELGLSSNVRFLGMRDNVADLLCASDLFLLPSTWEGMPISMLEALAAGLAVIGTDVAGIRDLAEFFSGCVSIVPPKNAKALSDAVIDAIENPILRLQARKKAPGIVAERFGLERMAARYIDLHEHLYLGDD